LGEIATLVVFVATRTQVVAENGLGEDFQPSVKASCVGGTMTIRVDTAQPFDGVVHGPNRTEPGCSVQGTGGLKTYLKINLAAAPGTWGSCGVKYDPKTEERRVAIGVRAHNTIELLEDRLYVVTCAKAGFQNSRDEVSVVQMKVTDPGFEQRRDAVLEGRPYSLRVEVVEHDPAFGILIKRCFAFDNSDTSVTLVDSRGCRAERLISEFVYNDDAGTAEATIFSVFRMPQSNRTYFQCDVEICKGSCLRPTCDLETQAVLQRTNAELGVQDVDPFDRSDSADTVTTSTSVFVAEPGSPGAELVGCIIGADSINPTWLTYLAIAFGVLFAIMLLINIFLCSAMTCSCTRTEVIEKEPSIYDDYSVYNESQYGYAGKQGPYSESEYGSEYGEVEPGEHGIRRPGSDYSGPDRGSRGGSRAGRYLE